MQPLERSDIWRHLSHALEQLAPLADGRTHGAEEQRRAEGALDLILKAIKALLAQEQLYPDEAKLLELEAGRIRVQFQSSGKMARAGLTRGPVSPQASYDRLNRALSALKRGAETGTCRKPVMECVRFGLESDLEVLSDPSHRSELAEPLRPRATHLVREVQQHMQTLSVMQEIQSGAGDASWVTAGGSAYRRHQ